MLFLLAVFIVIAVIAKQEKKTTLAIFYTQGVFYNERKFVAFNNINKKRDDPKYRS